MPTIAEVDGTRVMRFPFDHDPPHVHAFGPDFRIKLAIGDARVLETRGTVGPADMRRLRQWVLRRRTRLGQLWIDARRSNPVGRIEEQTVHRIIHARAHPDFSVDLRFEDGRQARIDLSEIIRSAAIAEPFRNAARFIRDLAIVEGGDVLHWSDQFELHADSLRYRAFPDELAQDYGPRRGRGRPAA